MDIITKDFPVTAGEATDEYPHGTFEVILSAPTQDRDGEVVDSKAFEPLPSHITFDTDHSMTCDSVVGSGVPSYAEDGTLRVKGGYAADERSQVIRQKVADGHIRTTSVTFMAAERVQDAKGVPHVVKAELLNGTFTPVPSNRESVVLSAKALVAHDIAEKVGARNSASDASTIQSMHDSAVSLGASCEAKSHTPTDADQKVASMVREKLQELLAIQDKDTVVELHLDGQTIYSSLKKMQKSTLPDLQVDPQNVDEALDDTSADTTTDDAAAVEAAAESAVESADQSEESKALAHAIENAAHFAFGG